MVNTLHKQVIHAVLQPVMLRAPSCFCGLHTGLHSQPVTCAHHARLYATRPFRQRRPHFSNHRPLHATSCCRGARHATAALLAKAVTSPVPSSACRAAPAGHTASLPSGPAKEGPGLSGIALGASESSDEDEADSAFQVEGLSDEQANVDEAVTGYLQDGSAETVLVKSKAEAHEQVQYSFVASTYC